MNLSLLLCCGPQTFSKEMAAALETQLPAFAAATAGTVAGDFGKPQRHVEVRLVTIVDTIRSWPPGS